MPPNLDQAKSLAASVRFSADQPFTEALKSNDRIAAFRDGAYKHGLEISDLTTPLLSEAFKQACVNLSIPEGQVNAFVYSSSEIQAQCFSGHKEECIVRFSSGLVTLLDPDEFKFVAGHELGHFLLEHGGSPTTSLGLEFFSSRRAQEISADRLGLIACGNIDIAVRALMKTMSGLGSEHLRFDVGKYISQLNRVSEKGSAADGWNTHPSMAVRCRALLWFSMSRGLGKNHGYSDPLKKIDDKIIADLHKDSDRHLKEVINEAKSDLKLWCTTKAIVELGSFTKPMQKVVENEFSLEILTKLKHFLTSLTAEESVRVVQNRLDTANSELQKLAPQSYSKILSEVNEAVRKVVAQFQDSA